MRHFTWSKLLGCLALALLLAVAAPPATADEMWVHPAQQGAGGDDDSDSDSDAGGGSSGLDYALTPNGKANFSFSIPEELEALVSAEVVLLGKKDRTLDWEASLSVSEDGSPQDLYTASGSGAVAVLDGFISEVDVTSLFPAALEGGVDVAGLRFDLHPPGHVQIVGLRLIYGRPDPLADDRRCGRLGLSHLGRPAAPDHRSCGLGDPVPGPM